jgi:tetrahydromethanopterin S-methyltransferase subunit G
MKKIILTILLTISSLSVNAISDDTLFIVEQMDKRFNQMDKRFNQINSSVNQRFNEVNRRFDEVNKRFEENDKRFYYVMTTVITLLVFIFGYLLKERAIIVRKALLEMQPELTQKADKDKLNDIIIIIKELAKNNKEVEKIITKHNLKLI